MTRRKRVLWVVVALVALDIIAGAVLAMLGVRWAI